jgi:hypothetical protein
MGNVRVGSWMDYTIPRVPDCVSLPPWNQRGGGGVGAPLACGRGAGGSQSGRLERKPGTLYTLWVGCYFVCLAVKPVLAFQNNLWGL